MTPANSSYGGSPKIITTDSVIWDGPSIECLDICPGDTVSDVVYKAGQLLCTLQDSINLDTLDLKCLINLCESCPNPIKTIKTVFQLLIDKVCTLESLIGNGNGGTVTSDIFQINLKCLAVTDGSGNILNDDTNDKIIQSIIDQVCKNKTDIALHGAEIDDLDGRVTILENTPAPILTLPTVNGSCYGLGASLANVTRDVSADFCSYKTVLGTTTHLAAGVARQPSTIQQIYASTPGFVLGASTVGQTISNQWVVIGDLLNRIKSIEDTCCKPDCDKVKVGFQITFSDTTVVLKFTSGAGTNIPIGFTDCGSTLVISDTKGNTETVSIPIANNYETDEIDLSAFEKGALLTFTLMSKLCSDSMTCEKCITKTATFSSGCCTITNNSGETVLVVYETLLTTTVGGSNKLVKSVNLLAGESFTLPPNTTILTTTGELESTCSNLPEPDELKCYYLLYSIDLGGGSSTVWEPDEVKIFGIQYFNNYIPFTSGASYGPTTYGGAKEAIIQQFGGILQDVTLLDGTQVGDRQPIYLRFKAPSKIGDTFFLVFGANDYGQGGNPGSGTPPSARGDLFIKAKEETCIIP